MADDAGLGTVSLGQFNIADQRHAPAELGFQFQGRDRWLTLRPIAGGLITAEGSVDVYAGFTFDLPIGTGLFARPSFGPGLYRQGGGKDLGFPLEFRSGLEFLWRSQGGLRVGVEVSHISNASLGDHNPGSNSLMLVVSLPMDRILGRKKPHEDPVPPGEVLEASAKRGAVLEGSVPEAPPPLCAPECAVTEIGRAEHVSSDRTSDLHSF